MPHNQFALETSGLSKSFQTRLVQADRANGLNHDQPGITRRVKEFFSPPYKEIQAVCDLDLTVRPGEVVAFLGPNGAGKSTTIKMLTGILRPSSGSARVLGLVPWADRTELSYHIGSVFGQKSQLWFHLPPSDSFELLAAIYEIPWDIFQKRKNELVDRFGLGGFFYQPVRKLSLGQRIRCEIAASFLHAPRMLFLDEPTIGLDVVVKQEIRKLLIELNREQGTTILLTSHDIGDIEKICQRAIIIHHGQVVVDEPVKQLRRQAMAKKTIGVRYTGPVDFLNLGLFKGEYLSTDQPNLETLQGGYSSPDHLQNPLDITDDSPEARHNVVGDTRIPGLKILKINSDSTAAKFEADTRGHRLSEFIRVLSTLGEVDDLNVEDEPLEEFISQVFQSATSEEARNVGR